MAEDPSKIESMRKWVVDHKLRAVGCLWLGGISSSIAYNWSRPNMKTSVKIIHARSSLTTPDQELISCCARALDDDPLIFVRLHAQALTLAALVGSACVEYYDNKYGSSGPKVDKYTSQYLAHSHKD